MAELPGGPIAVQLTWVGTEEIPVVFVNQMLGQVDDRGDIILSFGQMTPPALLGTPRGAGRSGPPSRLCAGEAGSTVQHVALPSSGAGQRTKPGPPNPERDPRHDSPRWPRRELVTVTLDTVSSSSAAVVTGPSVRASEATEPQPVAVPPDTITEGRTVPFMIEKAQAYYWSTKWQEGLAQTIADLQADQYVRFDSDDPTDVARWLLDGND